MKYVAEPFDPAYISNKGYQIPDISDYEKKFYHKVSILLNKLRRNHIRYEWLEDYQMFRVSKYRYTLEGSLRNKKGELLDPKKVYSKYPSYMYISVYDNKEYAFGGWETDLLVSTRITDIIESVKEWLSNNEPALR